MNLLNLFGLDFISREEHEHELWLQENKRNAEELYVQLFRQQVGIK